MLSGIDESYKYRVAIRAESLYNTFKVLTSTFSENNDILLLDEAKVIKLQITYYRRQDFLFTVGVASLHYMAFWSCNNRCTF